MYSLFKVSSIIFCVRVGLYPLFEKWVLSVIRLGRRSCCEEQFLLYLRVSPEIIAFLECGDGVIQHERIEKCWWVSGKVCTAGICLEVFG